MISEYRDEGGQEDQVYVYGMRRQGIWEHHHGRLVSTVHGGSNKEVARRINIYRVDQLDEGSMCSVRQNGTSAGERTNVKDDGQGGNAAGDGSDCRDKEAVEAGGVGEMKMSRFTLGIT